MVKKKIFLFLIYLIMLFSGSNFLPEFKIYGIPIFQMLLITAILTFTIINRKNKLHASKSITYYKYYLLAAIPSLLIGLFFSNIDSLLIYTYSIIPLILFRSTYLNINEYSGIKCTMDSVTYCTTESGI